METIAKNSNQNYSGYYYPDVLKNKLGLAYEERVFINDGNDIIVNCICNRDGLKKVAIFEFSSSKSINRHAVFVINGGDYLCTYSSSDDRFTIRQVVGIKHKDQAVRVCYNDLDYVPRHLYQIRCAMRNEKAFSKTQRKFYFDSKNKPIKE